MQPTETPAQAASTVDELVHQAATALPAGASLKFNDGGDNTPCDDPTDNGPAGRVFVEKRYQIVAPDGAAWTTDQVKSGLVAYWQQQHYRPIDDRRADTIPTYRVETTDGYRLSIAAYDRGDHHDFTLSGNSPCLWPNGTPDPQ
ncbi:hypothetical protein [Mangrovihabitans endophyticus]|uniref:hypothetical protein n=1 Tax=Mangrovihabitans endophyticus TaxID=1751298 RepID=UPI001669FCE1|nr:hypothetical protein [Mangrovihabitans endophyticus]